jgi:hypothetical protein
MSLQSRWFVVGCLIAAAIGCDAHSSAPSRRDASPKPNISSQRSIGGLREFARVSVDPAHHVYDVVSDGRAIVWDQGNSASEAFGGRILMWRRLGDTSPRTVATAAAGQVINDAAVFGDEVFYRVMTHAKHSCDGDPQSCFSWSLWRRTMPDGTAVRIGRGSPTDQTLVPRLIVVGTLGVAYQQPRHHQEAILFAPLGAAPRKIVPDAVPGSLSADDRFLYMQVPASKHCCVELRIDPRRPAEKPMRTLVAVPATKFYSAFGPSTATIVMKKGRLVLGVISGTTSTTQVMAAYVYDMFWVDADHLLLDRADGLIIYTPTNREVSKLATPNDVDIGAAVHTEASVLTFASPAGKPTAISLWRSAS